MVPGKMGSSRRNVMRPHVSFRPLLVMTFILSYALVEASPVSENFLHTYRKIQPSGALHKIPALTFLKRLTDDEPLSDTQCLMEYLRCETETDLSNVCEDDSNELTSCCSAWTAIKSCLEPILPKCEDLTKAIEETGGLLDFPCALDSVGCDANNKVFQIARCDIYATLEICSDSESCCAILERGKNCIDGILQECSEAPEVAEILGNWSDARTAACEPDQGTCGLPELSECLAGVSADACNDGSSSETCCETVQTITTCLRESETLCVNNPIFDQYAEIALSFCPTALNNDNGDGNSNLCDQDAFDAVRQQCWADSVPADMICEEDAEVGGKSQECCDYQDSYTRCIFENMTEGCLLEKKVLLDLLTDECSVRFGACHDCRYVVHNSPCENLLSGVLTPECCGFAEEMIVCATHNAIDCTETSLFYLTDFTEVCSPNSERDGCIFAGTEESRQVCSSLLTPACTSSLTTTDCCQARKSFFECNYEIWGECLQTEDYRILGVEYEQASLNCPTDFSVLVDVHCDVGTAMNLCLQPNLPGNTICGLDNTGQNECCSEGEISDIADGYQMCMIEKLSNCGGNMATIVTEVLEAGLEEHCADTMSQICTAHAFVHAVQSCWENNFIYKRQVGYCIGASAEESAECCSVIMDTLDCLHGTMSACGVEEPSSLKIALHTHPKCSYYREDALADLDEEASGCNVVGQSIDSLPCMEILNSSVDCSNILVDGFPCQSDSGGCDKCCNIAEEFLACAHVDENESEELSCFPRLMIESLRHDFRRSCSASRANECFSVRDVQRQGCKAMGDLTECENVEDRAICECDRLRIRAQCELDLWKSCARHDDAIDLQNTLASASEAGCDLNASEILDNLQDDVFNPSQCTGDLAMLACMNNNVATPVTGENVCDDVDQRIQCFGTIMSSQSGDCNAIWSPVLDVLEKQMSAICVETNSREVDDHGSAHAGRPHRGAVAKAVRSHKAVNRPIGARKQVGTREALCTNEQLVASIYTCWDSAYVEGRYSASCVGREGTESCCAAGQEFLGCMEQVYSDCSLDMSKQVKGLIDDRRFCPFTDSESNGFCSARDEVQKLVCLAGEDMDSCKGTDNPQGCCEDIEATKTCLAEVPTACRDSDYLKKVARVDAGISQFCDGCSPEAIEQFETCAETVPDFKACTTGEGFENNDEGFIRCCAALTGLLTCAETIEETCRNAMFGGNLAQALALVCDTSDDDDDDDDSADDESVDGESSCFAADATVQLENGNTVAMSQLSVGDRVLVAPGQYSAIFMFTHKNPTAETSMVAITGSHARLECSAGHYIPVADGWRSCGDFKAGDSFYLQDGSSDVVQSVHRILKKGLYNPQTEDGRIIVDGVMATTFTTAVHPALSKVLRFIPRLIFYALRVDLFGPLFYDSTSWITRFMPHGSNNLL